MTSLQCVQALNRQLYRNNFMNADEMYAFFIRQTAKVHPRRKKTFNGPLCKRNQIRV